MFSALRGWVRKREFNPTPLSILINPHYLARKGLRDAISRLAGNMKGGILLDVGCGIKPYRELFAVDHYVGIDVPVSGHDRIAKYNDLFFDGKTFPFKSGSIDFLFCSEVLEHVFEPEIFLSEMNRILKPEGLLLLTVPFVWEEHEQPYDHSRYTSFGIQYLIQKSGFQMIAFEKTGNSTECITQLMTSSLYSYCSKSNVFIRTCFSVFLLSPAVFIALILSAIGAKNMNLYLDNVILAEKPSLNKKSF